MEIDFRNSFIPQASMVNADTFSQFYPIINQYMMQNCKLEPSRDGEVREMLDFRTHITNPYRRCVGGYGRDINVFFLLAEAMWIACGRKDVAFLTLFNKQMAEYSDNGKVFHAPYGYRLRHWGIESESEFADPSIENRGFDQVVNAIRILSKNPNTRQVVMEIWNPKFDLGQVTKDLPCNDIVMLKIRDGKLITTIGNRSNDLHWGLPTNVFQFSFLSELIALSLGVELGTQTHNSQSLHIYSWNKVAENMLRNYSSGEKNELYGDYGAREVHIDFKFDSVLAANRFGEIEVVMNLILSNLERIAAGEKENEPEIAMIEERSLYFYKVYKLLKIYLEYKAKLRVCKTDEEKDTARLASLGEITLCEVEHPYFNGDHPWDISTLALNFFYARLSKTDDPRRVIGTL